MTIEYLLSISKEDMSEAAKFLNETDIDQLVIWLDEKDDKLRYPSLLMLSYRAEFSADVSSYWEVFCQKLGDENSYQRSIGLIMIAANAKWMGGEAMAHVMNAYLHLLHDEKPITVRQCVQGLIKIVPYHRELHHQICDHLLSLDLLRIRETMRKLVLIDILQVLLILKRDQADDRIDQYIANALSGSILDSKSIKQLKSMLQDM